MPKREDLIEELKRFKTKISKDMPIQKLILFGSRATGKAREDSDVDLIVVSKNFKKLNFIRRAAKMYDYWDSKLPVDFLCYTPEEFEKLRKQVSIVSEALKEGIEV